MVRTAPPRQPGRMARTFTGLAAAVVLLGLLAGLPYLLVTFAGNPFVGLGNLGEALSRPDNGEVFLRTVAIVGWLAWGSFALSTLVEIPAHVRGRRSLRIPGLRLQQKVAAALIAAIVAVIVTPGVSSAVVSPAKTSPAAVQQVEPDARTTSPTTVELNADSGSYREHRVSRGESLLGLAERYGVPLQVLAEANYGIPQPDGGVLQPGQNRIYTGWILRVPSSPYLAVSSVRVVAQTGDPLVYVVERGDWLYHIAERFLGDGDRHTEIAAINPQLEAEDHRFPNHIERTWRIKLPPDAHDRGPRQHAAGHAITSDPGHKSSDPSAKADGRPDTGGDSNRAPTTTVPSTPSVEVPAKPPTRAPASPSPQSAAPTTVPSTTPVTTAPHTPAVVDPTESSTATTGPTPTSTDDGVEVEQAVIISSALAGAGLLSALVLRIVSQQRRRQQAHRGHRRRQLNPHNGAIERRLRVAEQPADVDRLDGALRHLAGTLADREPDQMPDIWGAWVTGGAVQITLAARCPEPPAPWTEDGHQWSLPANADLPDLARPVAPLPTLVTIGSQPGRHLLIDLERAGTVTINGDREHSAALLRYIASELACNSWSDDVEIILAGFPPAEAELLVALSPDRIRVTADVTGTLDRLRRRSATIRATLRHNDLPDTFTARVGDIGDIWAPQVLLIADSTQPLPAGLDTLTDDLSTGGRTAVAVVITASTAAGPNRITIDPDGTMRVDVPHISTTATAAGLPSAELGPLAEIMTTARAAGDEPTPPAAEAEEWAEGTDAAGGLLDLFSPPLEDRTTGLQQEPAPSVPNSRPEPDDVPGSIPTPRSPVPPDLGRHELRQPTTVPAISAPPRREIRAAVRQRRHQVDPDLDRDIEAWRDRDPSRPRISVLGPVSVEAPGTTPEHRQRFVAEIIVFLAQRGARGADRYLVEDAIWPDHGVKDASVRVAITRARRWLGETPDGQPWIPDMGSDRVYRIADGYMLDWHLFRRLRARGEAHGPAGVKDLQAALELVRGAPLDGADRAYASGARNPYTWLPESDIYPPHIVAAIADTAHQLAEMYLDIGETSGARWAIHQAWRADPHRGDDELWLDIMRVEHLDGHHANLRTLLADLLTAREAEVPEDLHPTTYTRLINLVPDLLKPSTVG